MIDKDKRIAELKEKIRSTEEKLAAMFDGAVAAAYTPFTPAGPLASQTELELRNTRATTAENAAMAFSRQRGDYRNGLARYSQQAIEMFLAMRAVKCMIELTFLCMVGARAIYGRVKLRFGGSERATHEFLY